MDVKFYTQSNGKPWGVFVTGHLEPELVIQQMNDLIIDAGYLEVSTDYVSHVYAAHVVGIQNQPLYNTHVFESEVEGSTAITWIDGNLLEEAHSTEISGIH